LTKEELVKKLSEVFEHRLALVGPGKRTPEEYLAELTEFVIDELAAIKSQVFHVVPCEACQGRGTLLGKPDEQSSLRCELCQECKGRGFQVKTT